MTFCCWFRDLQDHKDQEENEDQKEDLWVVHIISVPLFIVYSRQLYIVLMSKV